MKRLIQLLFVSALMGFFMTSCGDDDGNGGNAPNLTVTANRTTQAAGGSVLLSITTNGVDVALFDGTNTVDITGQDEVVYQISTAAALNDQIVLTVDAITNGEQTTETVIVTVGPEFFVNDFSLVGNTNYSWTADVNYVLDGLVYLEEGSDLDIEEGTVIRALQNPTTGENTSALIITRGATINAVGTSADPIIFTANDDQLNGNLGTQVELWGGLIVLGQAPMRANGSGEGQVEGIDPNEPRGTYGGTDPDDDSGVIRYVSIRHSGVGVAPGDEIQGLTLGAVGAGTEIAWVEIFASGDDGIEFFGGTVLVNRAAVAFAEDDSYDWDLGYRGGGQFWFALQDATTANHACECDGAVPDNEVLYSIPLVWNATFIGSGMTSGNASNTPGILMRDNTGGTWANSIFADFPDKGIEIEDLNGTTDDAYNRIGTDLFVQSNLWQAMGKTELDASAAGIIQPTADADEADAATLATHLADNNNKVVDPEFTGVSRTTDGGLDPRPQSAEVGQDATAAPAGYETAAYHGAFDPAAALWTDGWSTLSILGYTPN